MPELFLEIRSQELAARDAVPLLKRLLTGLFEELTSRGFSLQEIKTGLTPRRVVLTVRGLPEQEPEREKIHLGPPMDEAYDADDEPTEALRGFCERLGIEPGDLVEERNERGHYAAWIEVRPGAAVADALIEMIPRHMAEATRGALSSFGSTVWPRPLTGLAALLDGEPLDLEIDGFRSAAVTVGHPHAGDGSEIAVDGPQAWTDIVEAHGIVPSFEARRGRLAEDLERRAKELGGEPVAFPRSLDRRLDLLAASCAIPTWIHGRAELGLEDGEPLPEPLRLAALDRARAVGLRTVDGLSPFFFTVVDRPEPDDDRIRQGFERAVLGRLSDARFAFETDQARPLAQRVRRLEQLTFHPRLGTWAEKSRRLRSLVEALCRELDRDDILEAALEASTLLKADLATNVVQLFPDLKGTAGGFYARREGYVDAVWQAIHDQYLPARDQDPIPRSLVGQVAAVADRLGTLVGFFGITDGLPNRKQDPHRLRPMASGLLRILIEGDLTVDLDLLAARAVRLYGEHLEESPETILKRLQSFLAGRLDHLLGRQGFQGDEIAAVKAVGTRDLPDLYRRLQALRQVRGEQVRGEQVHGRQEFRDLVLAAKRIANMITDFPETELDVELLTEEAEMDLYQQLLQVQDEVQAADGPERYETTLRSLLALVPVLDRFFADVLVMDEDERRRANRMALLQSCRRLYFKVARLNAMEATPWAESDYSTTT